VRGSRASERWPDGRGRHGLGVRPLHVDAQLAQALGDNRFSFDSQPQSELGGQAADLLELDSGTELGREAQVARRNHWLFVDFETPAVLAESTRDLACKQRVLAASCDAKRGSVANARGLRARFVSDAGQLSDQVQQFPLATASFWCSITSAR
jgi:hypothetical protein